MSDGGQISIEQAVQLEPSTAIQFSSNVDGKPKEVTYLKITNNDKNENLAFKVKTTAPKNYQVKPFQGVLTPGTSAKVEITIVPGPENDISTNRFQIQARFTELKQNEEYMLAKIWASNTKTNTLSKKLKVEILNKDSAAAPPRIDTSLNNSIATNQINQSALEGSNFNSNMAATANNYPDLTSSQRGTIVVQAEANIQQTPSFSQSQNQSAKMQPQFEQAPSDSMLISDNDISMTKQSNATGNMNSAQREIHAQQLANSQLKQKINEIIAKKSKNDMPGGSVKGEYQWKDHTGTENDLKLGKSYSISQALIVAILCMSLGYYLASMSPGPQKTMLTSQI